MSRPFTVHWHVRRSHFYFKFIFLPSELCNYYRILQLLPNSLGGWQSCENYAVLRKKITHFKCFCLIFHSALHNLLCKLVPSSYFVQQILYNFLRRLRISSYFLSQTLYFFMQQITQCCVKNYAFQMLLRNCCILWGSFTQEGGWQSCVKLRHNTQHYAETFEMRNFSRSTAKIVA